MNRQVYVSATVDPETADWLEREAKERGMKISPLVRVLLREHAVRQPAPQPAQPTQATVTQDS